MFSLSIFSTLLKGAENTVGFVLMTLVRTLFYNLCSLIYWGLRGFCNVFFALCNGQLLDTETLNSLFGRVGLLLGVIMMFRVAFSFIQVLINPDAFSDNEKGIPNIIKKSIIVIIMFGMSSYAFSFLRTLQGEIIESNVISKFLLPQQVKTDNFGGAIEAELFTAFYNLDPSLNYDTSNECATEDYINSLKKEIAENNNFDYKKECVNEAGKIKETDDKEFFIKFNFIFSILIGIVACYFFINYCISVGVRIIQLAFLQIISPMAIVGYLSPKSDNMFTKWLKVYFSTYIDVFLRMAIINIAIYLIAILIEGYNNSDSVFYASVGYASGSTKTLIFIFMVMAIFTFAKKAPDLLKKIFPAAGDSGLSLGLDKDNLPAIGTAAALGGLGVAAGVGATRKIGGKLATPIVNKGKDLADKISKAEKGNRWSTFTGEMQAGWKNLKKKPKEAFENRVNAAKEFGGKLKDDALGTVVGGVVGAGKSIGRAAKSTASTGVKAFGDIKGAVTSGKSASSAFDVISKAKGGYQGAGASFSTKVTNQMQAINHINEEIKNDKAVSRLQAQLDKLVADGASSKQIEDIDTQLNTAKQKAFENNDKVQAAIQSSGMKFKDFEEFSKTKDTIEIQNIRDWKPSNK